jgi:hypothetical protein
MIPSWSAPVWQGVIAWRVVRLAVVAWGQAAIAALRVMLG